MRTNNRMQFGFRIRPLSSVRHIGLLRSPLTSERGNHSANNFQFSPARFLPITETHLPQLHSRAQIYGSVPERAALRIIARRNRHLSPRRNACLVNLPRENAMIDDASPDGFSRSRAPPRERKRENRSFVRSRWTDASSCFENCHDLTRVDGLVALHVPDCSVSIVPCETINEGNQHAYVCVQQEETESSARDPAESGFAAVASG